MGVREDINWLKGREELTKVFLLVASKGRARLRELYELFGVEDWWPVKAHLRALADRGLVSETEGTYELTDEGRKVYEGFKAIERVEPV